MAEITRFLGMSVGFCEDFEAAAHVHVSYNQHQCIIATDSFAILSGSLPMRALMPALEWVMLNNDAIKENWDLHKAGSKGLPKISPLIE